jgi:hypothetical protein
VIDPMAKQQQKVVLSQIPVDIATMTDEEIDAWAKETHAGFVKATPAKARPKQ